MTMKKKIMMVALLLLLVVVVVKCRGSGQILIIEDS